MKRLNLIIALITLSITSTYCYRDVRPKGLQQLSVNAINSKKFYEDAEKKMQSALKKMNTAHTRVRNFKRRNGIAIPPKKQKKRVSLEVKNKLKVLEKKARQARSAYEKAANEMVVARSNMEQAYIKLDNFRRRQGGPIDPRNRPVRPLPSPVIGRPVATEGR